LKSNSRIQIYWGTATTGRPHLGYFVPMLKLADFLNAGCDVKVLFADLHGFLDNMKSSWEALEHRCAYYTFIIRAMLALCSRQGRPDGSTPAGVGNLEFVRGSSYQLDKAYTLDVYKMSVLVTTGDTTRAGAEVVKQTANPLMSNCSTRFSRRSTRSTSAPTFSLAASTSARFSCSRARTSTRSATASAPTS
jgi:tyrosyl-tRNA synthetase